MLYKKWTDDLEDLCMLYRGIVVHHVVTLESLIDELFMTYYVHLGNNLLTAIDGMSKQEEFRHTILSKQNFNLMFKFNSLAFIIEKHLPDYVKKFPDFISHTRKIIELRNEFAHRKYSNSLSNLEKKEIVLVYHTTERNKIRTEQIVMNPQKIDEFSITFFAVYKLLDDAGNLLSAKGI